jgi:transmembrane sensor
MDNQNLTNHQAELISTYLSGNASEEQIAELEAWVLADPQNKKSFIELKKAWMLSALDREHLQETSTEKTWEQTISKIFDQGKVIDIKPSVSTRAWWGIAAAIIVLVFFSFWFMKDQFEPPVQLVETTDQPETIQLADGSTITLNQASSLAYIQDDQSGERQVILEGDAFFEVNRDEENPFVIKTQNLEIKVLGTSFYVDSRQDQPEVQVIVESGTVSLTAGGSSRIINENEKGIWVKETNQLLKEENKDPNFTAVKTNILKFESVSMKEVAFALSRQFGVNVSLENEDQQTCMLYSTFTDKPLDSILLSIEELYGLKPVKRGSEIILTGECK